MRNSLTVSSPNEKLMFTLTSTALCLDRKKTNKMKIKKTKQNAVLIALQKAYSPKVVKEILYCTLFKAAQVSLLCSLFQINVLTSSVRF